MRNIFMSRDKMKNNITSIDSLNEQKVIHHNLDEYFSSKEVAQLLGITIKYFYNIRCRKEFDLPFKKWRQDLLFKKEDVLSWMENHLKDKS
jgi:predicted DNA-binding transcriptional regulator AlpA